jgi:hypothetical protein
MTQRISEDRSEVLRVDRRGRVRSTAAQREAALAEFDRSGLSGIKFAALAGINYQTFAAWLGKRRKAAQPQAASAEAGSGDSLAANGPLRWVEAVVDAGPKATLLIELPGGMRLEIGHAAQVPLAVQLLKALQSKEGRPC